MDKNLLRVGSKKHVVARVYSSIVECPPPPGQLTNYSWLKFNQQLGNTLHNRWQKINQPQLVKIFTHWVNYF